MSAAPDLPRLRVARVIARLNVGGPAHHVTTLTARLPAEGFDSTLFVGRPGPGEASFDAVVDRSGVAPVEVRDLGPAMNPVADLRAVVRLARALRRQRPHIVHTHTAKAGALGRLAALAVRPRPIIVHTFHGHVLEGYFGRLVTAGYRLTERLLARPTDRLVGVSDATVDDLVRLKVAGREKFTVIPLGFELDALLAIEDRDVTVRTELGAAEKDVLLTFVGRLAPIKRVDVLLDAFGRAGARDPSLRLAIVGDGELRPELEAQAARLGIADRVCFAGFRFDLPAIASATDVAVLASDNEGTPVALIEASAAGRPSIATEVGGVGDIVDAGTGRLVARRDVAALAAAMIELAADPGLRAALGAAARERVRQRYSADRLVSDVAGLYRDLWRDRARPAV